MVSVESTRVRQKPDGGVTDRLLLPATRCTRPIEGGAEGGESHDGKKPRLKAQDLPAKEASARPELVRSQLVGAGRGAAADVRQAVAEVQQGRVGQRGHDSRREARPVEGRPEPVAGAGEVVTHRRRVQARIDATEHDVEPGCEDVGQEVMAGIVELGDRRAWRAGSHRRLPPGCTHAPGSGLTLRTDRATGDTVATTAVSAGHQTDRRTATIARFLLAIS